MVVVLNTNLNYTETVEPLGSVSEAAKLLKEMPTFRDVPDDKLKNAVSQAMYEKKQEFEKQVEVETLESIRKQVETATKQLAGQAAKIRFNNNIPEQGLGKMMKIINTKWKDDFMAHGAMTREEFSKKYKWVQNINNTIKRTRTLSEFPWLLS